eukprot:1686912-Rhodomonas_salina.2
MEEWGETASKSFSTWLRMDCCTFTMYAWSCLEAEAGAGLPGMSSHKIASLCGPFAAVAGCGQEQHARHTASSSARAGIGKCGHKCPVE